MTLTNIQKRFLLFLVGCIGSRLAITITAAVVSLPILKVLGFLALIPVIGWLYIIFVQPRETGAEVFGEKIWWKNLRPLHTVLWATFAGLAITGDRNAYLVLLTDTTIGLAAFLAHHQSEGNI